MTPNRLHITPTDLDRMRANLYVTGPDRNAQFSRFWALLILASIIASAGVVADSTATVIGAMIVAPLMLPILGTVLGIVTGDRPNLFRSAGLVVTGALTAIAIGYVMGLASAFDVVAATNSQVAGRVSPRLIDLVAALATGTVGAFAQCREDVSDTLPGVAIAISLVPPLAVVGLTLEAGAGEEAAGALLLFLTNVAAIIVTGCIVMALYRVHVVAARESAAGLNRRHALLVVAAFLVLVLVPLGASTAEITADRIEESDLRSVAEDWASAGGWTVVNINRETTEPTIVAIGPLPAPDTKDLRRALDEAGLASLDVRVRMIPEQQELLEGS